MEITIFVPNGMLFLYDSTNKDVQVPEYKEETIVSATESCISISAQSEVDGQVTLTLSNRLAEKEKEGCLQTFNGTICTPGKSLELSTSVDLGLLKTDTLKELTKVTIWANEDLFPSIIRIEAD